MSTNFSAKLKSLQIKTAKKIDDIKKPEIAIKKPEIAIKKPAFKSPDLKKLLKKKEEKPVMPDSYDATKLELSAAGDFHTHELKAIGHPQKEKGKFCWYRESGGKFSKIAETESEVYQPSVEDVGARICCQWTNASGEARSTFAEIGPLLMDPSVEQKAKQKISNGTAVFTVVGEKKNNLKIIITTGRLVVEDDTKEIANFTKENGIAVELSGTDKNQFRVFSNNPELNNEQEQISVLSPSSSSPSADKEKEKEKEKDKEKEKGVVIHADTHVNRDVICFLIRQLFPPPVALPEEEYEADRPQTITDFIQEEVTMDGVEVRLVWADGSGDLFPSTLPQQGVLSPGSNLVGGLSPTAVGGMEGGGMAMLADLRADLALAQREVTKANRLNETLRKKVEELEQSQADLTKQNETLQTDKQSVEAAKEALANDVSSLTASMQQLSDKCTDIGTREVKLKKTNEQLTGEVKNLQDLAQQQQQVYEALEKEHERAKSNIAALSGSQKDIATQLQQYEEQFKRATKTEATLNDELKAIKQELAKKEQLVTKAEMDMKEVDLLRIEVGSLKGKGQSDKHLLLTTQQQLKDAEARAKMKAGEAESSKAEVARITAELKIAKEKEETAQQELELSRKHKDDLHDACRAVEGKNMFLLAQIEQLEAFKARSDEAILSAKREMVDSIAAQKTEADEIIAERNFWKRKADSLSQQVEKMLKEQKQRTGSDGLKPHSSSSSKSSAAAARKTDEKTLLELESLRKSEKEAREAMAAYAKAFEQQLTRSKQERESNLLLADSLQQSHKGGAAHAQQILALRHLANTLSETINDKELQIEQSRKTNKMLGRRVQELESALTRAQEVSAMNNDQESGVDSRRESVAERGLESIEGEGGDSSPRKPSSTSATSKHTFITNGEIGHHDGDKDENGDGNKDGNGNGDKDGNGDRGKDGNGDRDKDGNGDGERDEDGANGSNLP